MQERFKHKQKKRNFIKYAFAIFMLLFLSNIAIAYLMHYYVLGSSCMTPAQVTSDSRCLYIMQNQVYEKASRAAPHQGHPCGTDVTSVVPADHLNNTAVYLLPNYVANICAAATPTPTPTPKPTATPIPTATPVPTKPAATPTTAPTMKPVLTPTPAPTAMGNPTVPMAATPTTVVMQPTNTPMPTDMAMAPTLTPTQMPDMMQPSPSPVMLSPTVTPYIPISLPVSTAPNIPAVNLILALSGISSNSAVPVTPVRTATVFVYSPEGSPADPTFKPIASASGQVQFDTAVGSPTHGLFLAPAFALGNLGAGQYQLVVKVPGHAQEQLSAGANKMITLNPGQITQLSQVTLLAGDIDGNGAIDIADYNGLLRCYGMNATTPLCADQHLADLNDDGRIDALDYNIFLYDLYKYQKENSLLATATPVPTVRPTAKPTVVSAVTPTAMMEITPTKRMMAPTTTPVTLQKQSMVAGSTGIILSRVLDVIVFLIFCMTLVVGLVRSKIFAKFTKKQNAPEASKPSVAPSTPPQETIDDVYYVKTTQVDAANAGAWLLLVNGDKQIQGFYTGKTAIQGFARIKGVLKEANGKKYIAISEVLPAV